MCRGVLPHAPVRRKALPRLRRNPTGRPVRNCPVTDSVRYQSGCDWSVWFVGWLVGAYPSLPLSAGHPLIPVYCTRCRAYLFHPILSRTRGTPWMPVQLRQPSVLLVNGRTDSLDDCDIHLTAPYLSTFFHALCMYRFVFIFF